MSKRVVSTTVTISIYTKVDADSDEEAKELAMERPLMRFCHQCSAGKPDKEWVTSGELDGTPQEDDMNVEEA